MQTASSAGVRARVFVLFALGYFVSYLYRGVNIGFAPFITRDVGLGAGDLGLLTSFYGFFGAIFAIQAGIGVALGFWPSTSGGGAPRGLGRADPAPARRRAALPAQRAHRRRAGPGLRQARLCG